MLRPNRPHYQHTTEFITTTQDFLQTADFLKDCVDEICNKIHTHKESREAQTVAKGTIGVEFSTTSTRLFQGN